MTPVRIRIPTAAQRRVIQQSTGRDYGAWWRAPYPFRDFAYYSMLRRNLSIPAEEAIHRTRTFPGGASNLFINLREAVRGQQ